MCTEPDAPEPIKSPIYILLFNKKNYNYFTSMSFGSIILVNGSNVFAFFIQREPTIKPSFLNIALLDCLIFIKINIFYFYISTEE